MAQVIKSQLSNNIIGAIYNNLLYNNSYYYAVYGYGVPWNQYETPPTPTDNNVDEMLFRNNIILAKKISVSDVAFSARNIPWTIGTVYDMYDDAISATYPAYSGATQLSNANFYVVTTDYNVYKCIFNNGNSPSTVQPTGNSPGMLTTNDGYIWKYMYTIPNAFRNKFITVQNIPVITSVSEQFYSGGTFTGVSISAPGSGYTTATISVVGNGTSVNNPFTVNGVTVTVPGSGYTTAPTVSFPVPQVQSTNATQYHATSTINASGEVTAISMSSTGYGYISSTQVTISPPVTGAVSWTSLTPFAVNTILYTGTNYYKVTVAGSSGSVAPTATIGTIIDGSMTLEFVGAQAFGQVYGIVNQARLNPLVSGGQIIGVQVVDPGIGYTFANLVVNGDGSGAVLSADFTVGDLTTNQATVELSAIKGALSCIIPTSYGNGYSNATVTISGDGVGAAATPIITNGQIRTITMTNYGSGYTYATATITGNGSGAACRVILAPYNGHGSNAVQELFATSLNIFNNLGADLNYGMVASNTYRQIGIIQNPQIFGSNQYYQQLLGSSCYIVSGTGNMGGNLSLGTTVSQNGNTFLVISSTPTQLLLQTSANIPPTPSLQLTIVGNSALYFNPTSVQNPQIDKFSGQLLIIDNVAPFTPSSVNQTVINTILAV